MFLAGMLDHLCQKGGKSVGSGLLKTKRNRF